VANGKVRLVTYQPEIYDNGRMFSVPDSVAHCLGLWWSGDHNKPLEIDVVVRSAETGKLVLADHLRMTSGTELYVTYDRLRNFGLKSKDSIIVEASAP
jgi:hypothetical protein